MKKIILTAFLAGITAWSSDGSASMDKRIAWWEMRVERIGGIREELQKEKSVDESVLALIDREMERAKKMTGLFFGTRGRAGTGGAPGPRVAAGNINEETEKISTSLFSLFYLNEIISDMGGKKAQDRAAALVRGRLEAMARERGDERITARVMEGWIGGHEMRQLGAELSLAVMVRGEGEARKKFMASISEDIRGRGEKWDTGGLHRAIVSAVTGKSGKKPLTTLSSGDGRLLDSLWSWRHLEIKVRERAGILTGKQDGIAGSHGGAGHLKYRAVKNREYLKFLRDLTRTAGALPVYDSRAVQGLFVSASPGLGRIVKFFHNSMSLGKNDGGERDEVLPMKGLKDEFDRELKEYQKEMIGFCRDYLERSAREMKSSRDAMEAGRDVIAQGEVDSLAESVRDHVTVMSRLSYAEEVMKNYRKIWDRFHGEAKSGSPSPELNDSVKKGTILPALAGFSGRRMDGEGAGKKFVKREGFSMMASLSSVLQMYRRMGAGVKDFPSEKEMDGFREALNKRLEMKTGPWVMTEDNFASIDKNLVKELRAMIRKGAWNEDSRAGDSGTDFSLEAGTFRLTIRIPRGWNEKKTGLETGAGIPRMIFESADRSAVIEVNSVARKDKNLKDASEEMLGGSGAKPVKKEWGKSGLGDFYWVMAKDGSRGVMESYAVEKGDRVIFVTGRVMRDKYRFFKGKFDGTFRSLIIAGIDQPLN